MSLCRGNVSLLEVTSTFLSQEAPNTYIVQTCRRCGVMEDIPKPHVFTFTTSTDMPLPDPRFLRFHASICRVAHLANVYSFFGKVARYRDGMEPDGTSADFWLHTSFMLSQQIVGRRHWSV